jgi:NADH:ubiquinone oxidoreductase subunit 6 (subunit J)
MKAAGLFLLFAGFTIVMSALVVLSPNAPRGAFMVAGIVIQILGLLLTFRAHYSEGEGR